MKTIDVALYFNFRSPYCYLASKSLAALLSDYNINLIWRPLGGWSGRSSPERAKVKVPLVRQDVARIARRMALPVSPPPPKTDPTLAAIGSILAEKRGILVPYIVEVMNTEWASGIDIGDENILSDIAVKVGMDRNEFSEVIIDPENHKVLQKNWEEAQRCGVMGVPSFVVDDQVFWGNDRIDYLREHLDLLVAESELLENVVQDGEA